LMKLTTRFTDPAQLDRIRRILQSNSTSLDVEVQQRAVEYGNLFAYDAIRRGVLEKMPPPQIKEESRVFGEATKKAKASNRKSKTVKPAEQDLLFDLMGDNEPPISTNNGGSTNTDLLADILGSTSSNPLPQNPGPPQSNMSSIMDLFDTSSSQPPTTSTPSATTDLFTGQKSPPPQTSSGPSATAVHPCYNNNNMVVTISLQRNPQGIVQVLARFKNNSPETRTNVGLQAAVPKSQHLQLNAVSNAEVGAGAEATQIMRVSGSTGLLRLKLRISYADMNVGQVVDQVAWSEPK